MGGEPARGGSDRHALVVVLTFVTGCADAIGFLALGGAFSSVMTGNMVLLGVSAGTTDGALASASGGAIASYVMGVLLGSRIAGVPSPRDGAWPRAVTRALAVELSVLLLFSAGWEVTLTDRPPRVQLTLLLVAAAALGIQSSAVQRFGVSGLSSTYLTGTLTTLIGGFAARRPLPVLLPSVRVLLALMAGAAAGAVVARDLPALSPALLIVPLAAVIVLGGRLSRESVEESARAAA